MKRWRFRTYARRTYLLYATVGPAQWYVRLPLPGYEAEFDYFAEPWATARSCALAVLLSIKK